MSIILTPRASGSSRIICRPTRPAPSMRPSRPPKPGEFCAASSSTTPPSTPVGSTWSRSRLACCAASASTAESTTQTGSTAKSTLGNDNETPPAPASIGCSQPTKPAPKWAAPIRSHPKSHNHCAEVLAGSGQPEGLNRRGQIIDAVQDDRQPGRIGAVAEIAQQHADRKHLAEEEPVILHMQRGPGQRRQEDGAGDTEL